MGARAEVFLDARDPWSLHDQRLVNRQLYEQLADPGQTFRTTRSGGLIGAADLSIGTQLPWPEPPQTAFHGYFVLDAFVGARPMPGIEITTNLIALNQTASAGYRRATQLLPGVALHLSGSPWTVAEAPVEVDFVTTDLQAVTLGRGLLLERVPLEGHAGAVRWNGWALREVFGGEAYWVGDDLQAGAVAWLDGGLELTWLSWLLSGEHRADYLTLSADWPCLPDGFRLTGELGVHLPADGAPWASAGLIRADWLDPHWAGAGQVHVGYQFRAYQRGFGPRQADVSAPHTVPVMPTRADAYVTNAFEFYAFSPLYDQLSHTVMLETRAPIGGGFSLVAELEWWARWAYDPQQPVQVVAPDPGRRLPGWLFDVWYNVGFQYQPWAGQPHRGRLTLANKHVDGYALATYPTDVRFVQRTLLTAEMEVFF